MVINSPCLIDKKELAIPGQTTTGKEFSNPLMAGSLPKTISANQSIEDDLLFDDEDGITCLTNDDIFENLALMGYEQLSTKLTFQKGNGYNSWQVTRHQRNSGGWATAQTRMAHTFELMDIVPPTPHDSPLPGGYTPRSDEEKVKKLERQRKSSISHPRRRIYRHVESSDDDLDEEDASKQGRKSDKIKTMFKDSDFDRLNDDIEMSTAGPLTSDSKGLQQTTRESVIMVEPDPPVKIKRSDQGDLQLQADAELAQLLHQEELAQVERRQRERAEQEEASIAALYEKLYEREQKWINDFFPIDFEKEEKKSVEPQSKGKKGKRKKRVADSALKHKSSKKQKMMQEQESAKSDEDAAADYEHEKEELRMWLTVVPDEEETMDLDILSAKIGLDYWKLYENIGNYPLLVGWVPDMLQHVSRGNKVSSHKENAREDVELEARS
ncbi:hypothetical protein Tco_0353116 [Tanacetum coccineum]